MERAALRIRAEEPSIAAKWLEQAVSDRDCAFFNLLRSLHSCCHVRLDEARCDRAEANLRTLGCLPHANLSKSRLRKSVQHKVLGRGNVVFDVLLDRLKGVLVAAKELLVRFIALTHVHRSSTRAHMDDTPCTALVNQR